MAKGTDVVVNEAQTVGLNEGDYQWETVHVESPDQITFDTIGDTFVGEYLGTEKIEFEDKRTGEAESFTQLKFRVGDSHYVVNGGYDLLKAFTGIPEKSVVRVQLRTLVDVGQQSPMKSYRVDVAQR